MADSESGSLVCLMVATRLSCLVSEIFVCDTQTDRQTNLKLADDVNWPPQCCRPAEDSYQLSWWYRFVGRHNVVHHGSRELYEPVAL